MSELFFSKELWATALGGFLSLIATFCTIKWQANTARKEREKSYASFFASSFEFVKKSVEEIDKISSENGYASYQYINYIHSTFDHINRHIDGFIFVQPQKFGEILRNFFYEIYFDTVRIRNIQSEIDKIDQIDPPNGEQNKKEINLKRHSLVNARAEQIITMKNRTFNAERAIKEFIK